MAFVRGTISKMKTNDSIFSSRQLLYSIYTGKNECFSNYKKKEKKSEVGEFSATAVYSRTS